MPAAGTETRVSIFMVNSSQTVVATLQVCTGAPTQRFTATSATSAALTGSEELPLR